MFDILDSLSERGVNFALSNVIEHKGVINEPLRKWTKSRDYIVHSIGFNYDNCNYQSRNKNYVTKEILVTNY